MPRLLVFTAVKFLHDLFTVMWVGGLLTQGLVILPAVRSTLGPDPQARKVLMAIGRRQSVLAYISMVGLVVTGLLEARSSGVFLGLLSFGNTYSSALALKHILVLGMIAISLYRSLALVRRGGAPRQKRLGAALLFLNIALAVAVLLLSGYTAAVASPGLPG